MNPYLKIAYQPYKWLIVIPFIFILTMFMASVCIAAGLVFHQGLAVNAIAVIWARLCCAVVPFFINIKGKENYDPDQSYIIVANHQSMADIPILQGYLGLKIKWIMKKELEKIPIFGFGCHQLGCIYVDRRNSAAAIKSIQEAKTKLAKNASVLFFAEGTRTRDGKLLPFKKGAFRFAKEIDLPILPITIENSIDFLPSDSLDLIPGTIHITVHPPVDISDHDIDELDSIIKNTRNTIASALRF
ncbi:MAG: 1-acyl-sn-glycerol-3-phosphate acyltransferase [Proteobacteria bacterium]|nr:1-acyl-sn-glycerol-3-phosphate acyltransferase [Pseudomonadota bacterium]MBU1389618.1 1-acyl-sn-glycerol-3-phosphate acyltransferase [Pseudomonadota bacterium]MBU1542556.1 1-acyl-sn-glycerol-3-phosphate acyltransferase [Pseudomonadota bacterium]MBU2429334.1 1-acyl-sn-glycerol-3-phosphate acyltransferase [Pseudomonadota bacterium]MBU2479479.1 1-acyl-sn-glycerol-3-phosphate acyltransferase [Pseudomonadota bacterium]